MTKTHVMYDPTLGYGRARWAVLECEGVKTIAGLRKSGHDAIYNIGPGRRRHQCYKRDVFWYFVNWA